MAPRKGKKEPNPMDPANRVGENSHNERTRYPARDYNCFAYDPVYSVAKIAEGERVKLDNPPGWYSFPEGYMKFTEKAHSVPPKKGYPTPHCDAKYNDAVMKLNDLNVRRRQWGEGHRLTQNAARVLVGNSEEKQDKAAEVELSRSESEPPIRRHFFKLVSTARCLEEKRADGTLHVAPVITQDINRDAYLERIVQMSFSEKPKKLRYPELEEWSRRTFFPHREVRRR
jgi:hypothetical protein